MAGASIYCFNSGSNAYNAPFPGVPMTHVEYNSETKQNLWYYDFDASLYDTFILVRTNPNTGENWGQTADIAYDSNMTCFTLSTTGWDFTISPSVYTPDICAGYEYLYFVDMPWWNEGATYETYLYAENTETLVNNDADGLGVKMNVVDTVDGRNVLYANFDTAVYNSFTFVRYNTETGEKLKTSSNTLVDGNNVFALYKENSTDLFSYSY